MPKLSTQLLLLTAYCLFCITCTSVRGDESHDYSVEETQQRTSDLLKSSLQTDQWDVTAKRLKISRPQVVLRFYERNGFVPVWSHGQQWLSPADSLFRVIENAQLFGLFPEDYHFDGLIETRDRFRADTISFHNRSNPLLWANADLMLTDAFVGMIHDIRLGRLPSDSLSERLINELADSFYVDLFDEFFTGRPLSQILESLEPAAPGYLALKKGLPAFLRSIDEKPYTRVPARTDPSFRKLLQRRLYESGFLTSDSTVADSTTLADAVKKFQKQKGLAIDGVAGEGTIRMLNVNDREKFVRIAISMDKYKLLPETMPRKYIWVNASANQLQLYENGKIALHSKVICGKPKTRTPLLTSQVSELITYPQWVPPPSIVSKEILPAVRKNPGYLKKKGFSIVDRDGNEVDPDSVDWSKYKTMPYRVVQGSGDANALGIMKFVFANKYSVYLHDTNQRYLFGNAMRSLSHGCVRVQEWEKLANYIIQSDSPGESGRARIDSMNRWLKNKEKRSIVIRNRLPVYIRYFTCEGTPDGIQFYDDVYGEDRYLREKYFAGK